MGVTIVIPNYNGINFLKDCLESLLRQTYRDYEIIIVDNASTDGSVEWVRENYPAVHIIRLSENKGFSAAVNIGIKASDKEFVALVNSDTIAEEDWLFNLVDMIQGSEDIFSCSSKMLKMSNSQLIDDAGDGYTIFGWAFQIGNGLSEVRYNTSRSLVSSCAGAAIYRRKLFSKVGFFDEAYFAYLEDVDIGIRATLLGLKNVYASKARILHYGSASTGGGFSEFKVRLSARNNIWLFKKNFNVFLKIINSFTFALGWLVMLNVMRKKGFLKSYLSGTFEGLRTHNNVRREAKYSFFQSLIFQFKLIVNTFVFFSQKVKKMNSRNFQRVDI